MKDAPKQIYRVDAISAETLTQFFMTLDKLILTLTQKSKEQEQPGSGDPAKAAQTAGQVGSRAAGRCPRRRTDPWEDNQAQGPWTPWVSEGRGPTS